MYYLFGAGGNCYGAINYFGRENIIALVDNSNIKIGTKLLGINIISIQQLLEQWQGETVIITAYRRSTEIENQLNEAGITNYFICPDMQSGFYSCDQIIDMGELLSADSYIVYERNPVSEVLVKRIKERKQSLCQVYYITQEELEKDVFPKADLLIICKEHYVLPSLHTEINRFFYLYDEMKDNKIKQYSYLEKFHNQHYNEECFLIGNGPSLRSEDLQKLWEKGIYSFGCNKIYMISDKTDWKPNYYVVGDPAVNADTRLTFLEQSICFIRNFHNKAQEDSGNLKYYYGIAEKYFPGYPSFSDNLVEGVFGGCTVMYDMLQIAAYMGFKRIYLLGVDFSWGEDGRDTHFCKDYMDDRLLRESMRYKEEERHAYIAAKRYADTHGIKIYNATRGGKLEVFERVDFDKIFE